MFWLNFNAGWKTLRMVSYIVNIYCANASQVASSKEVQKQLTHVILPKGKQAGYVYVGKKGLMGGGNRG
jgi:hypothetical protein